MATGKVSKNSRTSKQVVVKPVKEKKKKEYILIEVCESNYKEIQDGGLTSYKGMPVESVISFYGKHI
jgi:hypothetical protein